MVAAQGEGKDMKKWIEHWKPLLDQDKPTTGGMEAFLAKYGQGI